jgi:phage terminase large subunit
MQQKEQTVREIHEAIQNSPQFFVDWMVGGDLKGKQSDILWSIKNNRITTVRSCHGSGKSFTASRAALWFLEAFEDSIVITTAPTFRQVENVLWREIRGAHSNAKRPLGGNMLTTRLEFSENWYAIGISSKDSDRIQGFHAKSGYVLVIIDEAAGVDEGVFEAADSIASSLGARILFIGNPTSLSGRFYDSHHRDPTAHRIQISCFDTPNFVNNGIRSVKDLMRIDMNKVEITAPYLITPQWVKEMIIRNGADSPIVQARCFGQFPSSEENTLIPLNYIEAAATEERREQIKRGDKVVGADIARFGNDKTVITIRYGDWVDEQIKTSRERTTQATGRLKAIPGATRYIIDDIGVGGGVTDELIEDKIDNVIGANFAARPLDKQFVNLRAEAYWLVAEKFKAGTIAIPNDQELISQLASIRYNFTRNGIKIEEKEEIRKRIHRSPDEADSLVLSYCDYRYPAGDKTKPAVGKKISELYNEAKEF